MATSKAQLRRIARACESIWDQIGHEIPEVLVSAEDMLEITMDAGRMITYNKGAANDMWLTLLAECSNDVTLARSKVVEQCQFEQYEAGGAAL